MEKQTINKQEVNTREILRLIPVFESYMEYMIELIQKLPRVEKFSIGTEFKTIMYETYRNIMYVLNCSFLAMELMK